MNNLKSIHSLMPGREHDSWRFEGSAYTTAAELVSAIERAIRKHFPKSALRVRFESNMMKPGITIVFAIAGSKAEVPNGIMQNDLSYTTLFIWGTDKEGNLEPTLQFDPSQGGRIMTKPPEGSHLAFGSVKVGLRKKKGTPEQVLKHIDTYFSRLRKTLKANKDNLPANQVSMLKSVRLEHKWHFEEVTHEEDAMAFSNALSKEIKKHKKALNIKSIKQNYKGTGKQAHRRQLWIRFNNGDVIDIFLDGPVVRIGGVLKTGYGSVKASGRSPAEVAREVAEKLKPIGHPPAAESVQESAEEKQARAEVQVVLTGKLKQSLGSIERMKPDVRQDWVKLYGWMHGIVGKLIYRDEKYAALKNYNDKRIATMILQVSKKVLPKDALANLAKWKIDKLKWQ